MWQVTLYVVAAKTYYTNKKNALHSRILD